MTRLLLTLAAIVGLAAHFILIVISYAYASRPEPTPVDLHLRPRQPLPCVACVSLMAPPERP